MTKNASLGDFRYIREYAHCWSITILRVFVTFLKYICYTCIFLIWMENVFFNRIAKIWNFDDFRRNIGVLASFGFGSFHLVYLYFWNRKSRSSVLIVDFSYSKYAGMVRFKTGFLILLIYWSLILISSSRSSWESVITTNLAKVRRICSECLLRMAVAIPSRARVYALPRLVDLLRRAETKSWLDRRIPRTLCDKSFSEKR